MKRGLLIALFAALCIRSFAQFHQLEEVSFSLPATNYSTYLTDINDEGFVCGYYDSAGRTNGFVIKPDGRIIRFIDPATGGITRVEGINNRNLILISRTAPGGTVSALKAYYDPATQEYTAPVSLTGIAASNAVPMGLNNLNDFIGWYQSGGNKYAWILHDSIVPSGSTAWLSARLSVSLPPSTFDTYGACINDNNFAACNYDIYNAPMGWVKWPAALDGKTNTISQIPYPPFDHMEVLDINNSSQIVGTCTQANGVNTAFVGSMSPFTISFPTTLVNTIFKSNTIKSVANGINERGEIVGSYQHPATGVWIGFIYRPNVRMFRLPAFDWQKHTWSMDNVMNRTNSVWNPNYWSILDYRNDDPFISPSPVPLFDAFLMNRYPRIDTVNVRACPDWLSYAREADVTDVHGNGTSPLWYQRHWKPVNASKWYERYQGRYRGVCYGMVYTGLMKYANDSLFKAKYAMPSDLFTYTNDAANNGVITNIVRVFLRQSDRDMKAKYGGAMRYTVSPWIGLHRMKNECLNFRSRTNARGLSFKFLKQDGNTGFHIVLPYKIITPQRLPFSYNGNLDRDTVFVYDPNAPGDSSRFIAIDASTINESSSTSLSLHYDLLRIGFNRPTASELLNIDHSRLKLTAGAEDPTISYSINPPSVFYELASGLNTARYNASGHVNDIPDLISVTPEDTGYSLPIYYDADTAMSMSLSTGNYADSAMIWSISNSRKMMGISRRAVPGETDFGNWDQRTICYGTHDPGTKALVGYFMETDEVLFRGVDLTVSGLSMQTGDSIITSNPTPFVYRIHRVSGAPGTYDIWVRMSGRDSVLEFKRSGIALRPDATHTFVPFQGADSGNFVILIDQDNNGTIDSTLALSVGRLVNPANRSGFKVYPNPAGDHISLAYNNLKGAVWVSLSGMSGAMVYEQRVQVLSTAGSVTIPLKDLAAGIYLLQVQDDHGELVFKEKVEKR